MSDVPEDNGFEDMLERAQHGHFDKNGVLQIPDDGPWPEICPACEGVGKRELTQDELDRLPILSGCESIESMVLRCATCDGRGTVIAGT